jgi:hypothetical protein
MLNMLPFANSLVIAALQQTTLRVGATAVGLAVVLIGASNAYAVTVTEQFVSPTPAGTPYPRNKQNESPMAVNPTDARNVITGANDERLEPLCTPPTGGSSTCTRDPSRNFVGVYVTRDGGSTWSQQILDFSGAALVANGDPVVTFGPKPDGGGGFSYADGARAYFAALAAAPDFGPNQMLIAVSHSDDNGVTWSAPVVATTRDNPVNFNDRLAIHADANPSSPFFGHLYVSWTLFKGSNFAAEPIVAASSTDGGLTFGKPRQLTASNNNATGGRQSSQIHTAPDGTVFVFWHGALFNQDAILGARSTDGGVSFDRPFLVSFLSDLPNPLPGTNFRVNSGPAVDIDAAGAIYVVWPEYTSGHGVVKLGKSTDAGETWRTATAADVATRTAFFPTVAVSGNNVFIGFNAIDDKPAGTAPGAHVARYDAYYVISTNSGDGFGAPAKISAVSSDPDATIRNDLTSQFIGDYNGAAASPDGSFWFSWTDTRNGAACAAIDAFRTGGIKPNIYDLCPANFGNSDIFVGHLVP